MSLQLVGCYLHTLFISWYILL